MKHLVCILLFFSGSLTALAQVVKIYPSGSTVAIEYSAANIKFIAKGDDYQITTTATSYITIYSNDGDRLLRSTLFSDIKNQAGTQLAATVGETVTALNSMFGGDKPQVAEVSITNAQFVLIRATPITIVAAPGAGYMIEFIRGEVAFDYTAAYTETTDNLELRWGAAGVSASELIECTGFVTATADSMIPVGPSASLVRAKAIVDNKALVLQNNGDGEFGGGNAANVIRVRVLYRIVSLGW